MSSIEPISKDKETGKSVFLLKDSTPALANALRRLAMEAVPSMAIEEVEFRKNTSALYDEMLAHRLGLVPLSTDLKGYEIKEECKCGGEGCNRCTLKLTLKAKGPGYVYASELKSKDPKVKPVYPEMIVAKLLKGQEIELEATAVLGRGRRHTRFASCLAWYNYKPKITVNNESSQLDAFVHKYPPQVIKDGKIDKKLIEEINLYDAVDGINDDIVKVEHDSSAFVFSVEPWGQLTSREIMIAALDELDKKLQELDEQISQLK